MEDGTEVAGSINISDSVWLGFYLRKTFRCYGRLSRGGGLGILNERLCWGKLGRNTQRKSLTKIKKNPLFQNTKDFP